MIEQKPIVSIVIPTRNSEMMIVNCLESIITQTHQNVEVIVVDNYSNDNTRRIAEQFHTKVIITKTARSKARNIGAENSISELILFLDSDMELSPRVVEECIRKINEGYDAVIIPEVSVGEGFWAKCKALEKSCYIGDELIEASRFFKRKVFENTRGYDPELEAGEDWDLCERVRKAGYRIGRINALVVHHEGKLSLWQTMNKKYKYGKTIKLYKHKHPILARQQLGLMRPAFIRNWRRLARDPIHTLGMFFMKACELGAFELGARW